MRHDRRDMREAERYINYGHHPASLLKVSGCLFLFKGLVCLSEGKEKEGMDGKKVFILIATFRFFLFLFFFFFLL